MPWGFAAVAGATVLSGAMASSAAGDATDAQAAAAQGNLQLGREQLDFTKQQYADAKPARDAAVETAQQTAEAQLAAQKTQTDIASEYNDYNKSTFRPLEQNIVSQAENYDTPEKRQAAADASMSDVNQGFARNNAATARQLAANGINPGSTRAMSVMQGQGVEQAKAQAGAAYKARQGVESVGHAMEMDAASLGRNLPSSQTAAAQTAIQAGAGAVNASTAGLNATNAGVTTVQAGYNGAVNATTSAGNLFGSAATTYAKADAADAESWAALGKAAGQYYAMSDENVKKDIQPVADEEALAAVNATPVKKWRYDPAKMAAGGIEPGMEGEQIGPMAQDVKRTMGDRVAPGGKKISLVSLNGINMKAVQAVDKKVDKLTKQVSSLAHMIRGGQLEARAA